MAGCVACACRSSVQPILRRPILRGAAARASVHVGRAHPAQHPSQLIHRLLERARPEAPERPGPKIGQFRRVDYDLTGEPMSRGELDALRALLVREGDAEVGVREGARLGADELGELGLSAREIREFKW